MGRDTLVSPFPPDYPQVLPLVMVLFYNSNYIVVKTLYGLYADSYIGWFVMPRMVIYASFLHIA